MGSLEQSLGDTSDRGGIMRALPAIEYVIQGETGPAVLFLAGSYSTSSAWRGLWAHLRGEWQLAATSLLGCGATVETRRPGNVCMAHEVAVVAEAVRRLGGGPVHLVGHSFGGTVALAAALTAEIDVASLALFEANPFELIAADPELYTEARALAVAFTAALDTGEVDAARRIIDYWGGAGSFAGMPAKLQDLCRQTASANALDWQTCFGFRPPREALAALEIPVLLVRGERAIPAMVAITDALAAYLPDARSEVVAGAGHFLISTHAEASAALLLQQLGLGSTAPHHREGCLP